jgi:tetratricopeptide (TPR) repeat protein
MRTVSILLVLLVAIPSLAGAQDNSATDRPDAEQKAREHYAQGEAAFKAGQYDQALAEFEAGFATLPRPKFLLNIGHTERKRGQLFKARAAYKKYLLMEPDSKFSDNVTAVIAELDSAIADDSRAEAARTPAPVAVPILKGASAPRAAETATPMLALESPGPVASPDGAGSPPIYRRPWFWVAVGAVVVGAGGGIYLWQRPGSDGFQVSGSLGSLRP